MATELAIEEASEHYSTRPEILTPGLPVGLSSAWPAGWSEPQLAGLTTAQSADFGAAMNLTSELLVGLSSAQPAGWNELWLVGMTTAWPARFTAGRFLKPQGTHRGKKENK